MGGQDGHVGRESLDTGHSFSATVADGFFARGQVENRSRGNHLGRVCHHVAKLVHEGWTPDGYIRRVVTDRAPNLAKALRPSSDQAL